ncbi:MAG: hypothetical protein GC159_07100 [Phycisphaera sp.]|nr:hypothetical protein [Phycisphaera sp.]
MTRRTLRASTGICHVVWAAALTLTIACAAHVSRAAAPPAAPSPLTLWKQGVKIAPVSDGAHHSIHTYFNTSPESPDGRYVLFYASTIDTGYEGELRIIERATGRETVLARGVTVEDAHRAACQQWISGGRRVVYHNVLDSGEWVVMTADVPSGETRILARGWQLGFGQPTHDVVPMYGPHWNPGDHRDLALLNVETGEITRTAATTEAVRQAYPGWYSKTFGDAPTSVFFPILSPDLSRVIFKVATPAGGDFRSKQASNRYGLICYDLEHAKVLSLTERWGHPAWCNDSCRIIQYGGVFIDGTTGKATKIPNFPATQGAYHPSCSPDGKLFTLDSMAEKFGAPKDWWQILVGDTKTGESVMLYRFDHAQGAKSWRKSHPHPAFSPDGKRIYFNVSDGRWTRLFVAEASSAEH